MPTPATEDFHALIEPHFEALHRAALRLTRAPHDAEDLVQEVCIRAFAERDGLAGLDSVRGWLIRVQYRIFVDGKRRMRRSPVRSFAESEPSEDGHASGLPGPEEHAEAAMQYQLLESGWRQLSREQQALLALHAEGYALSELEKITGLNRNALSARLHRARRRLAKAMGLKPSVNENLRITVSKNGM